MQKLKDIVAERTKKVIYADKLISPNMFKQTLKVEVFAVLSQFMQLELNDVSLSIMVDPTGKYKLSISAQTTQIKPVGQIIK